MFTKKATSAVRADGLDLRSSVMSVILAISGTVMFLVAIDHLSFSEINDFDVGVFIYHYVIRF